jgi:hypothetical protein
MVTATKRAVAMATRVAGKDAMANGSTMVMFFFRVAVDAPPFLVAMFYLGTKGMCKTMFFHFVPVDGV